MTEEDLKELLNILEEDAKDLQKEAEPFLEEINSKENTDGKI